MEKLIFKLMSVAVLVASGSLARAAGKDAGTKVEYEKKTQLDFEAKDVDGEFFRPDGQAVRGDKNLDFDSLMGPRSHFKKELKRSAGAIR